MKLIIILMLLTLSQARVFDQECDVVSVHNINYEKEVLKNKISAPYQMVIDYDTNTLFFSYTSDSPAPTDDMFISAYLNLKTDDYGIIPGINGGFAAAVDKKSHKVYLGGRDGIYEFNYDTKRATRLGAEEHSIWQMFFKDDLYFTTYPGEEVYVFKNDLAQRVQELSQTKGLTVALDKNNNLYFSNSSGLFCYKKETSKTVLLGDYNLNSFTTDIDHNLFFSTPSGLYNIDENYKVNRLASMDNIYGVAVEGDGGIIYAAEDSIIRLKPTKKICFNEKKQVLDNNSLN